MIKRIHGKPVTDLEPVFHDPVLQFFYRKSFRLFFQRFCHKKSFSHGCAQSICADDFPLRIFLPQIIHAQPGSLVGSRHSGGKAQIEDISSFCQIRFQILQIDCRIDLRSGAKLSASLQSVKFFRCDRSGRTVCILFASDFNLHGYDLHGRQAFHHLGGKIRSGVRKDLIVRHKLLSFAASAFA